MKVATYNHMFGCNGRSLREFLEVHKAHREGDYQAIDRFSNWDRTVDFVSQEDFDVVAIAEVLGRRQREILVQLLGYAGFKYFHVGTGHGLDSSYGNVETLVVTRIPSETAFAPQFDVPAHLGYGGGVVGVMIPEVNTYVMQVHLPLNRGKTRSVFQNQMQAVLDEIDTQRLVYPGLKVILMGDFNSSYSALLKAFPQLMEFDRLSPNSPTCSTVPIVSLFYRKNLDHILGVGLKNGHAGIVDGHSDHRLVWAEVE